MYTARHRCLWSVARRPQSTYAAARHAAEPTLSALAEVRQAARFAAQLQNGTCISRTEATPGALRALGREVTRPILQAGFATFQLHVESRVSSALGEGFYTIGPCGEELLAGVGLALRETDPAALHYRHVATSLARQLAAGHDLDGVLLDRARAHCVSSLDPVTGGAHCAIGGGEYDFMVTSTLASQCTPAVGRALAPQLSRALGLPCKFPKDAVSYVSLGDGSVNNSHFLSARNFAEYVRHRGFAVPTVFAVSNNDMCISLRGHGWLAEATRELSMPVVVADGCDLADVYLKTAEAAAVARKQKRAVLLVFDGLPRRFGHAATDRQAAYLEPEEIEGAEQANPLEGAAAQAVEAGLFTYAELHDMWASIGERTVAAFEQAAEEPKLTSRADLVLRNSAPLVPMPPALQGEAASKPRKPQVMRQLMNAALVETLEQRPNAVYIGEDVEHGGYYRVSEGLSARFPRRCVDFPPDETSLVGAAIGLSQAGFLPICEIPYAKYLDCGADIFFEAAIAHWLSDGKQPNGMVIRLQGFDNGVFGGNFHTHNAVHIPPGVDVLCYSNGEDWVRGWRYAVQQAAAGRVVMVVDSTRLLNLRHAHEGGADGEAGDWRRPFPPALEWRGWGDVRSYGLGGTAIVTYGNGVVEALRAQRTLAERGREVVVVDSPCLSEPSDGLRSALATTDSALFADACKASQPPLMAHVGALQREGVLPRSWGHVGAASTYNPLGNTVVSAFWLPLPLVTAVAALADSAPQTFLSAEDIVEGVERL